MKYLSKLTSFNFVVGHSQRCVYTRLIMRLCRKYDYRACVMSIDFFRPSHNRVLQRIKRGKNLHCDTSTGH